MIRILPFSAPIPKDSCVINTTSRSLNWSRGLSPFFLGPVNLYGTYTSKNVENAWQFCKVYKEYVKDDNILPSYFDWAKKGWEDDYAHRYPMGKGAKPLFSLWDGERLGYIEARKKIYVKLYSAAVKESDAYSRLEKEYKNNDDIYLIDFDAYNHRALNMSYDDVLNCSTRTMGHAFVLAMMLEGIL